MRKKKDGEIKRNFGKLRKIIERNSKENEENDDE